MKHLNCLCLVFSFDIYLVLFPLNIELRSIHLCVICKSCHLSVWCQIQEEKDKLCLSASPPWSDVKRLKNKWLGSFFQKPNLCLFYIFFAPNDSFIHPFSLVLRKITVMVFWDTGSILSCFSEKFFTLVFFLPKILQNKFWFEEFVNFVYALLINMAKSLALFSMNSCNIAYGHTCLSGISCISI